MKASGMLTSVLALVMTGALVVSPAVAETGQVTRSRLANGMTVLVRENPVTPVVAGEYATCNPRLAASISAAHWRAP